MNVDTAVIGGGPAGLAAAIAAHEAGNTNILILERDNALGGILNQCIHNGFGLHRFAEELTGPEYAQRDIDRVRQLKIPYKLETTVLGVDNDLNLTVINSENGVFKISAQSIILAMGCRERPRGAINIQGTRPAGIFSAGTAQRYVNLEGYLPGRKVVVLGSGDIGLIMARRMTWEGAKVKAVVELMPYSSGLRRNIVQCLDDFDIPLYYSHTITNISGRERVESVTISRVDSNLKPIAGTEQVIQCDTLLLSVGLIPENEISKQLGIEISKVTGGPVVDNNLQTGKKGVFAAGNVLHVHDLVDFVSEESSLAGKNAAKFVKSGDVTGSSVMVTCDKGIRYTVPSLIKPDILNEDVVFRFRVDKTYKDKSIVIYFNADKVISRKKKLLVPGEMETIKVPLSTFEKYKNLSTIRFELEE